MRSRSLPRYTVCFFLAACAMAFTSCQDLGGPIEWATYTIVYHYHDDNGNPRRAYSIRRYGANQELKSVGRARHEFLGWDVTPVTNPGDEWEPLKSVRGLVTSVGQTIDLFAVWEPYTFTVIYHRNDGTGEYAKDEDLIFLDGARLRMTPFPRSGTDYFGGWATSSGGLPEFEDREYIRNLPLMNGGTLTLYVWWSASPNFLITFDFNGGSFDNEAGDSFDTEDTPAGFLMGIPHHGGLRYAFSRPGYSFTGWNTAADGSGKSYIPGDRFMPIADITLYAQWNPVAAYFTVAFDANNADGAPPPPREVSIMGYGTELPGAGDLSKLGYEFLGWSDRAAGVGTIFPKGLLFMPSRDVTLYARWVPETSSGTYPDIPWAAVAVGVPTTTAINFVFAAPVEGLAEADITVAGGSGVVTTGALTGGGVSWSLEITSVTSPGNVNVSIDRSGIAAGPQTVAVFDHEIPVPDIPWAAVAVGVPTTTAINFVFAAPVEGLTGNDILVVGGSGAVTTGVLTGGGVSWSLEITSVTSPGNVTVSINRQGVASGPQTVAIFSHEIIEPDIPWAAVAVGVPYTTSINFAFAAPVTGLVTNDIAVVGGTGAVTTGVLTMATDGRSGSLEVTAITSPGSVQVSINRQGIAGGPQTVVILEIIEPDIPWAAVAIGVPYTTSISFAFAAPVTGLIANDITVVGGTGAVTTGALTMATDGRSGSLEVTTITAPGSVYISINRSGIMGGSQAVEVFDYEIVAPDIPWAAVAIGVPYTTSISFAFAAPVTGLVTNDITVVGGTGAVTTGALTMAIDGRSGSLAVTAITTPGSVYVSINGPGIIAEAQAVEVFNHEIAMPDIPWAAVAIGVPSTTSISFAFAAPVTGLVTNDITVVDGTGAVTTGALTMATDGQSGSLAVTAITTPGSVSVSINRPGIAAGSQMVEVFNHEIPVPDIPWAVVAVGTPTTTAINFVFAAPVSGLTASDITVVGGIGAVTTDVLTMAADGRSGSLAVTAVTSPGSVYVSVDRLGIAGGQQTVEVIRYVPPITWTANAIGNPTTTAIDFTFSASVSLAEADITIVDGAGAVTRGGLSGGGTSWSLAVASVTSPGSVFVLIDSLGVASGPQMVDVIKPHSGDFTISFADFQDMAPYIVGPTVGLLGTPGTITVLNPEQFHGNVEWRQGGILVHADAISGSRGETLTLNSHIHGNRTGTHHVTVIVRVNRGGEIVPYSRIIRFTVELN